MKMKDTNTDTNTNTENYIQLETFHIRYGNEWIEIKIKFSGHQTFVLTYPRALEINTAQYYAGFFGHIFRAEYWWDTQKMAALTNERTKIMHARTKIAAALTHKLLKQLEESGE